MKNNLPRNILYGFLSAFLPLILTLAVTPLVVRGLGVESYGLFVLIIGFISYSFNFGIGRAVTKYVAQYRATGEVERIEDVLSATLFLNLLVGFIGAGILILLAKPFVRDVLLIEDDLQGKAVIGFYIAAVTIALFLLQQVFIAVLQAVGRFDWFSHITTIFGVVLSVGNVLIVFLKGDVIALLGWNLTVVALSVTVFYFTARKFLPEARFRFTFHRQTLWNVVRFSAVIVCYQILTNVWLLVERSWITRTLGTENLTFYAVPMTLAMYILAFVISLALVLMPLTSEAAARQDNERLLAIYERATKYIWLVVCFVCLSLIIGSKVFLGLWLGADFAGQAATVLCFHVLTFGSMSLGIVVWQMTEGLNFPGRNAWLAFFWVVSGIVLLALVMPRYGLTGAAAARAAGVVLSLPVYILLIERATFGKINWSLWQKIVFSLVPASAASAATMYFLFEKLPIGWLTFISVVFAGGLVYLGVLFLARFFTLEEQRWLRQFVSRAITAN